MKILNQKISDFNFQDVIEFCKEGYIEGTQLDYKKELPKSLPKHFAAFSNTRGGVIVIGSDEDKHGKPKDFVGVDIDAKTIEKIHQYASNVSPRPRYEIHRAEDTTTNKMFVLIRIEEGDKTPYYVQNDPHVYIRTGNISDPIEQAGPEMLELLFRKRERASNSRQNWQMFSDNVYQASIRISAREREDNIRSRNQSNWKAELQGLSKMGEGYPLLHFELQPFFPFSPFCNPVEMKNLVQEYREETRYYGSFPELNLKPFQDGVLARNFNKEGHIDIQQLYSYGLVRRDKTLKTEVDVKKIAYLSHIAAFFGTTLKASGNFYKRFGYQGVLIGKLSLTGIEGVRIEQIQPHGWNGFWDDMNEGMLKSYSWPFEIETFELFDKDLCNKFIADMIKEMYWSLGMTHPTEELLQAFYKQVGWIDN